MFKNSWAMSNSLVLIVSVHRPPTPKLFTNDSPAKEMVHVDELFGDIWFGTVFFSLYRGRIFCSPNETSNLYCYMIMIL